LTWYKSSPVKNKLPKANQAIYTKQEEQATLDMLMKDLSTLVKHMDSIKTLNHTFQKPISIITGTNPTNDWQGM